MTDITLDGRPNSILRGTGQFSPIAPGLDFTGKFAAGAGISVTVDPQLITIASTAPGGGAYTAGAGLTLSGSTFSLTVPVTEARGGTGKTAYTDGQLLIGDTSTGGLDTATLTAGTGIAITNGHGSISVAVRSNIINTGTQYNMSGITSTSLVMMGMGGTNTFTPAFSGNVFFVVQFSTSNNTAGGGMNSVPCYGTGTAPAFGGALTGTTVGGGRPFESSTINADATVTIPQIVVGLTVGTTYWFDLAVGVIGGGSQAVNNTTWTYMEIP